MSELTPQQELFLEYLFNDPECDGSTHMAAKKAGYSREYHYNLVRSLNDEILRRSSEELAFNAPKAVKKLIGAMDEDGSTPKGELRLKAVESVLDRAGLIKKQEFAVSVEGESPLFFIPAKIVRDEE